MTPDAFPADVSVAIVAHNARETLKATVASVLATGCPESRVTVIDVKSTDESIPEIHHAFPRIRIRNLGENRGPSPGRNVALLEAMTPYVLLMDADVFVEPDTISLLRRAMEDPRVAVGSPVVVHADQPDLIQYAGTGLHFICEAVNPWLDRPVAERGSDPRDIGAASGCALLIARRAAVDVGLFDERYFIGKEDGDFTHRLALAGYRVLELPQARVRHRSRPRGPWLFYYQIRNRWHVILKNYELRTILLLAPAFAVHELLQAAILIGTGHGWTYLRAVRGLLVMLPSLPADRARVARIRIRPDRELLRDDPLVARPDLLQHPAARLGKTLHERALRGYWRLVSPLLSRRRWRTSREVGTIRV